jgi:hypothetical protein
MINTQQVNKINYIVVCINEFAARFGVSSKEAFNYLNKYSGISFLKQHYEIEHTLSIDNAIEDLILVCKRNGGDLH